MSKHTTQVLPITVCTYCHHDGVECQYHRPHRSTICRTFCYCDTCVLATAKCSTFAPRSHNLHAHACIHQYYSFDFLGREDHRQSSQFCVASALTEYFSNLQVLVHVVFDVRIVVSVLEVLRTTLNHVAMLLLQH